MQSPLAEANPESLQEIFNKDPLKLTDEDADRIVAENRAQRERWELAEKKTKQPKAVVLPGTLSLKDLGI